MKIITLCVIVLASLATACVPQVIVGSGRVTTETRSVSNFTSLALSGFGDVTITQGDAEALAVEAEDNLMPYLKTEVRNGTLYISVDNRNGQTILTPRKPVRFTLAVKDLKSLDLSGAGHVLSGNLKSDRLTIQISGAGGVDLANLEATDLTSTVSGAGNLQVGGQVMNQTANLNGVGNYKAADLSSQSARINVNGVGSATVWVKDNLDVSISGVGSVNYYGSPRVQQARSGVGSISNLGDK